ncbi:MAG: preprotein translocase subunit YajC [Saprospiraceae bacterium]
MILDMILLQAAGNSFIQTLPLLVMVVVIWLFFIRPQTKKAKEEQTFITDLEKGMEVVTKSGMIGKINKIDDREIQLQVDTKTFIGITRGAVSKELTDAYHAPTDDKK